MAQTIKVAARSKNEVLLKLYMDQRVYTELSEHARPLGITPLNLVRALIAERFPNVPTQELRIGGSAPEPFTDNAQDEERPA
jgi:hypothetical protein